MRSASRMHRVVHSLLLVVLATALPACQRTLAPSPNLYTQSDVNPYANVIPEFQNNKVDVIYFTDRKPEPIDEAGRLKYGWKRSHSLAMGVTTVEFGRDVAWEDLVEASTSTKRKVSLPIKVRDTTELFRLLASPYTYKRENGVIIDDPDEIAQDEQIAREIQEYIGRQLEKTDRKDVYVFVHGFNNSFEYSAGVIAEIWHFLGREGVPIVYSWPAGAGGGLLRGYSRDRESGEFTVYHLKQFAKILEGSPGLEHVHVIAHSRGTDVLTEAVRELAIENRAAGKPVNRERFATLILAAADLDLDVTTQRVTAEKVPLLPDRTVLYISNDDKALGVSGWLSQSSARIGNIRWDDLDDRGKERIRVAGDQYEILDARVDSGFLGHSYFYGHPAVLSDMILLLRDRKVPGAENGRPMRRKNPFMWQIENEYPFGRIEADGTVIDASPREDDFVEEVAEE